MLLKRALIRKNWETFGELVEEEAVDLHLIAMSSNPGIFYWNEGTVEVMREVRRWREEGLMVYYTMDAGANVHVLCQAKDETEVNKRLKKLLGVKFTIVNKPAKGTRLI